MDLEEDLQLSRELIKEKLGKDSLHLCWPRGFFDEESIKIAKKVGYKCLYTVERGGNLPNGNMDRIKRLSMKEGRFWLWKSLNIYSNSYLGSFYSLFKKK